MEKEVNEEEQGKGEVGERRKERERGCLALVHQFINSSHLEQSSP